MNINRLTLKYVFLMMPFLVEAQMQNIPLNFVSKYSGYLNSYSTENLKGKIKSLRQTRRYNQNYHGEETEVVLGNVYNKDFYYELNEKQELTNVKSLRSNQTYNWSVYYVEKKERETTRQSEDGSIIEKEIYEYDSNEKMICIINIKGLDTVKTEFKYRGVQVFKVLTSRKGYTEVKELIGLDESIHYEIHYTQLNNEETRIKKAIRYRDSKHKSEISYLTITERTTRENLDSMNFYLRLTKYINEQGLIAKTKNESRRNGIIETRYLFDQYGKETFREEDKITKNEKNIYQDLYSDDGIILKRVGEYYENDKLIFSTINTYEYDKYGNLLIESQSGQIHRYKYKFDEKKNWIERKYYIGEKLYDIVYRKIEYY